MLGQFEFRELKIYLLQLKYYLVKKKFKGNRLAIITNGGGAGVMAADCASGLKVILPSLSEDILQKLNQVLPPQWSHQNPIDIIGDATPERYHAALEICKKDEDVDAILTMLVPVAMSQPLEVAKQIVEDSKNTDKTMLVCWMGDKHVKSSWKLFAKNNIPYFNTPEKAVEAFSYLNHYYQNQKLLLQDPALLSTQSSSDVACGRRIIESVLASGRTVLTAAESKSVLKAFNIPVTKMIPATTEEEAVTAAKQVGFPVVMKINSPDISHQIRCRRRTFKYNNRICDQSGIQKHDGFSKNEVASG